MLNIIVFFTAGRAVCDPLNSSAHFTTRKQLPAAQGLGPHGALTGQLDDESHQVWLSLTNTTVLPEPELCPAVILGPQ